MSQIPTHGVDVAPPGGEGYDPLPHNPPAGDWQDDDGIALDDYFKAAALGPQIYGMVQALVETLKPTPNNRFIRRRFYFTTASNDQAVMALPADPNRSTLAISVSPVGTNTGVFIHSESFNVRDNADNPGSNTDAFRLEKNSAPFVIDNYTGPLWVAGASLDGATIARVDILAVTS